MTKSEKGAMGVRSEDRIGYLDDLRVGSIVAVMLLHVSAQNWSGAPVGSFAWQTMNAVNSVFRWGAPAFVMISGALLLDRDDAPGAWARRIGRLAAAFLFWSAVYAALEAVYEDLSWKQILFQVVSGHYHMWFLFMIAGLYLIAPLLRNLVRSPKLAGYFLLLALLFNFALPQAVTVLGLVSPSLAEAANSVLGKTYFHFAMGFSGYFVLGYVLRKTELTKTARRAAYVLGLCGCAATAGGTAALSLWQGSPNATLHTYFSLNVLVESVGVFVLFKSATGGGARRRAATAALSKATFGAYLIHPMVMDFLKNVLGLQTISFAPVLSIPVITALICAASYALSFAIGRIPKLGRWIV